MIIDNGTIEFKRKAPAAPVLDPETGLPQMPQQTGWDKPIPCQIIPNTQNLKGSYDGEHFTIASFTILIEEQPLPQSEQVRLTAKCGREIGEFSLIAPPEYLQAVCEIKLMV